MKDEMGPYCHPERERGTWGAGRLEDHPLRPPHTQVPRYARDDKASDPSSFILHPSSFIFHPSSFILHSSSFIFHPSSFILYPSSFILHPSSFPPLTASPP